MKWISKKSIALTVLIAFTLGITYSFTATAMKSPLEPWIKLLSGDISVDDDGVVTVSNSSVDSGDIIDGSILEADIVGDTADGLVLKRVAKGSFAFSALATTGSGSMASGITLPANSIVTDGFLYAKTAVQTTTGNPTLAIGCSDGTSALLNVQSGTFFGLANNSSTQIIPQGTVATQRRLSAGCNVFATVASGSFSQGVLDIFLEYSVTD